MGEQRERSTTVAEGEALWLRRGGPYYRLERLLGLVSDDGGRATANVVVPAALVWLPLLLLSLLAALGSGGRQIEPLFREPAVHIRLLGCIPLLLLCERSLDRRVADITRHLAEANVLRLEGRALWSRQLARVRRWRDTWVVELTLLVAVYALTLVCLFTPWTHAALRWVAPTLAEVRPLAEGRSPAWWWYVLVAQPFLLFLSLRVVWHWLLWSCLLVTLPRARPDVLASHPDRAGGLGILAEALPAFRWLVVAVGVAGVSAWIDEVLFRDASRAAFAPHYLAYVVVVGALAFAPYLPLSVRLFESRSLGTSAYSRLAREYVHRFDRAWLPAGGDEQMLGSPDFSGLADIGASVQVAFDMRATVFEKEEVLVLITLAVVVALPLAVIGVTPIDLVKLIFQSVAGGE